MELPLTAGLPTGSHEYQYRDQIDPELGPRGRDLFYFGQRIRDRLLGPDLVRMMARPGGTKAGLLWKGEEVNGSRPYDTAESAVSKDWGHSERDARQHPVFPLFQHYLDGTQCLQLLEDAERAIRVFATPLQKHYAYIRRRITSRLPSLSSDDRQGVALSLIKDTDHRLAGFGRLAFSYATVGRGQPGVAGLSTRCIQLSDWKVGNVDDPAALTPVAEVHRVLARGMPKWNTYRSLREPYRTCREAVEKSSSH